MRAVPLLWPILSDAAAADLHLRPCLCHDFRIRRIDRLGVRIRRICPLVPRMCPSAQSFRSNHRDYWHLIGSVGKVPRNTSSVTPLYDGNGVL
ncbi:hypothetical protein BJ166DRAFT_381670 [Pestalotiopsis sp. NC0098]|nr:hypothetical protein BJ166DRAFT_381670 [Pestalotiopsis sp. NC0098]